MRRLIVMLSLSVAGSPILSMAQTCLSEEVAFKVKDEAFNKSQIEEIARFMTDDLGPRLAASQLKLRSESLVVEKLSELGLSNSRSEYAIDFKKGGWDNTRNYVAMTSPYYCSFAANPKAWSGSTAGMVKGDCILIDVQNEADLEKYKGKINGKVVVMPITQTYEINFKPLARRLTDEDLEKLSIEPRPGNVRSGRSFSSDNYNGTLNFQKKLDVFLKEEGALAILNGSGSFNVPSSRGVSYSIGEPEPMADIILPIEDHGRIVRMLTRGKDVTVELDIRNEFTANGKINNVIAEIPGSDSKLENEVVLIGAHLDSWHGGTGAADNASGCIVMMEAMRIIRALGISPKRTIRIALWGGEEQGLYGSRGYATNRLYSDSLKCTLPEYDNFALYLNMDNGSGRFRGIYLEEYDMAVPFFEAWKKPVESLGFNILSLRQTGSTDHVTFSKIGLPAYQFIQDPLEYGRTYHTTMDTFERLSLSDLKVDAAIVAWLAINAAMDSKRIPVKSGYPAKLK